MELHVHGIVAVGKLETALLLSLTKAESTVSTNCRANGKVFIALLFVIREVLLNNGIGLHVNLLICVILAIMNLLHTTALLDEQSITIDWFSRLASCFHGFLVKITNLEDVL